VCNFDGAALKMCCFSDKFCVIAKIFQRRHSYMLKRCKPAEQMLYSTNPISRKVGELSEMQQNPKSFIHELI